jgi:hypothetical protein
MGNVSKPIGWGVIAGFWVLVAAAGALGGTEFSADVALVLDGSRGADERIAAIQRLGASGDLRAVDPLLALVQDSGQGQGIRGVAARAVSRLGEPRAEIIPALEKAYRQAETGDNLAWTILLCLGRLGSNESIELLSQALDDQNAMHRFKVAQALGMLSGDEALKLLASRLGQEPDRMVRAEIVCALGRTPNAYTEAVLAAVLDSDPQPLVRMNAVAQLAKFKTLGQRARAAVEGSLNDPSAAVRKTAKGVLP